LLLLAAGTALSIYLWFLNEAFPQQNFAMDVFNQDLLEQNLATKTLLLRRERPAQDNP
jgi:hypothetical protein